MNSVVVGLVVFVAVFGGALLGMLAARWVPKPHLGDETRSAVSLSMAVVGTLSALVIGLLISTANTSFLARADAIGDLAVDVVRLNRSLIRYGPEAEPVRATLRAYAEEKVEELSPRPPRRGMEMETLELLGMVRDGVGELQPTTPRQRDVQAQALKFVDAIASARWLLKEKDRAAVPGAFLVLLTFWLAILFASFGLFAPSNATVVVALFLCSVAVAGGIFMIMELATPFEGLIHPPLSPLHAAIVQLRQN